MKPQLDIPKLIASAKEFCQIESLKKYRELYGVTDGKAIGTFVEHRFQDYLEKRYDMTLGSSAIGLDLPSVNCDIKVTSLKQPQSSCPSRAASKRYMGLATI